MRDDAVTEWVRVLQVSEWRGSHLAILVYGGSISERLNLHIDETGNQDLSEDRHFVAVILHEHGGDIEGAIARYEARLFSKAVVLPGFRFHCCVL